MNSASLCYKRFGLQDVLSHYKNALFEQQI